MWETWFTEGSAREVRARLKKLTTELQDDEKKLHRDIGEQFTDIIALSERLESLWVLAERQQTHLHSITSNDNSITSAAPSEKVDMTAIRYHTDAKLGTWLASNAERSIYRKKYAAAAQSIYLADELKICLPQLEDQRRKLCQKLNQWLKTGSLISQSTYTALLIFLKCTPLCLSRILLDRRLSHIKSVLRTPEGSPELFKLIDSTAFIYAQITNDLAQSRLVNRKLVEMPAFASSNGFSSLISPRLGEASSIRCYPTECYDTKMPNGSQDITEFLVAVSDEIKCVTSESLKSVVDIQKLTFLLSSIVQQSQDVINAETGVVRILNAFEPAFAKRFLDLIDIAAKECQESNWESKLSLHKKEIAQLSRISRSTKQFVPEFSIKLEGLALECQSRLSKHINDCYRRLRNRTLELESTDLKRVSEKFVSLRKIDEEMRSLGGTVDDIPRDCYIMFAELIREHLDFLAARTERKYFGENQAVRAFEIQCIIDEYLSDFEWSPTSLEIVRNIVLEDVPTISDDGLLLTPIV